MPRYYTPHEVADIIGVHVNTARKFIREGRIKAVRIGEGPKAPYRVSQAALHEWERRNLA